MSQRTEIPLYEISIKGMSSIPTAMTRVPYGENLPIPQAPAHVTVDDKSECEMATSVRNEEQDDPIFKAESREHHLIHEGELNNLVRDLSCQKKRAQLLGSRLKGWNLL